MPSSRCGPASPIRLGATWDGRASISRCFPRTPKRSSCACSTAGQREEARIELPEYTDEVWHGYLPEARPDQLYGYRVHGPYDPQTGHRFNPNKLLLDPYAEAICAASCAGAMRYSAIASAVRARISSFDRRDSARCMPKCRVVETGLHLGRRSSPAHPLGRDDHL